MTNPPYTRFDYSSFRRCVDPMMQGTRWFGGIWGPGEMWRCPAFACTLRLWSGGVAMTKTPRYALEYPGEMVELVCTDRSASAN